MTTVNIMALAVTVLVYMSVYATSWQDRYSARFALGAGLALILAVII